MDHVANEDKQQADTLAAQPLQDIDFISVEEAFAPVGEEQETLAALPDRLHYVVPAASKNEAQDAQPPTLVCMAEKEEVRSQVHGKKRV